MCSGTGEGERHWVGGLQCVPVVLGVLKGQGNNQSFPCTQQCGRICPAGYSVLYSDPTNCAYHIHFTDENIEVQGG